MELNFSINGEFVTKLAKDWLFMENRPYEKVEELLLSCMCGTNESNDELKKHVQDILLGRAELKGNTADGTFRLVIFDEDGIINDNNVFTAFGKLNEKYLSLKEELSETNRKYQDLLDCLQYWVDDGELDLSSVEDKYAKELLKGVARHYGDYTTTWSPLSNSSPDTGSLMLDSFIKASKFDDNYGWLDPQGNFYPVEFAEHQSWAYDSIRYKVYEEHKDEGLPKYTRHSEIIDLSHYQEEFLKWREESGIRGTGIDKAGDFLANKGWILVHSPNSGIPYLSDLEIIRMTKAQKEFMYDYYTNRNETKEANRIYEK